MAGADTTTASEIMKEYFLEGVNEELNNSSMLYNQVQKNRDEVEGDRIVASHHIGRNAGIGSRLEGETLPLPGAQAYDRSEYFLHANYGVGRISTKLMKSIKTNRGAFVNAARDEMKRIRDDLKREVNFQYWGTSDGVIAATDVVTAVNVLVLDAATERRVWNYLHKNMLIDIGTIADPTAVATNRKITAINRATREVTIDGAAVTTNATTHRIFRAGSGGAGGSQRVVTGLQTIIGTATYAGIDPTDVPEWKSYVDSSGGLLTEDAIQEAVDESDMSGAGLVDLVVTTHAIRRKFGADLKAAGTTFNQVDLVGGFKAVSIATESGELKLTTDRDVPDGNVFGLNTGELTEWEYADWEFLDEDGSVLHLVSGVAAYDFTLEKWHELGTTNRKAHFRFTGVTTS